MLFGCAGKDYIDMKDVYIKNARAYLVEDNTLVSGKVRSFGGYIKPGVTAIFSGKKIIYEGHYSDGLKDYKWRIFGSEGSLRKEGYSNYSEVKEIWDEGELLKVEYYKSGNSVGTKYINGSECAKEPIYKTEYLIKNESSIDVILTVDEGVQRNLERQSAWLLGVANDCEGALIPSENIVFENLQINKGDAQNNLILIYNHDPIIDSLWSFDEKSEYDFEYTLIISDELFN